MLEDFRLRVFLTVSQTHSFTGAARLLGITQPAVSQNIAELERQTGAQLLVRQKGDVSLTEQGKVFAEFASGIQKKYSELNAVFSDFEAYSSIIERASEIKNDPLYPLVKDNILK